MFVWDYHMVGAQRGAGNLCTPSLSYADADDLFLEHLLHLEGRESVYGVGEQGGECEITRFRCMCRTFN